MATSRTPTREPASSYIHTPSPSRCTFSAQRAEFTKPVPAALLPVYPIFSGDSNFSDSGDEASIVNISTEAMATPQGQKTGPSAAEGSGQLYQDLNAMATTGQISPVRGFAEKSGISPTSKTNPPQKTADLDRSPSSVDYMKVKPEKYSNSVMAKLASFLGLQKRQEQLDRSLSSVIPPPTEAPLPTLSSTKGPKYSPFPSPLRFDSFRDGSSSSANYAQDHRSTNMLAVIENSRMPQSGSNKQLLAGQAQDSSYTSATYRAPVRPLHFLRHHRSRSLNIIKAPATHFHVSNQAASAKEAPPPDSRSRSMDDQSRRGQNMFMDGSLSSYHGPPVSLPPNCVFVQVWAVGLDESDRQLVVGSSGCIIDEAYKFKQSQEPAHQQEKCEEAINYSIFKGSKLLRWSLDFGAKKKERALPFTPSVRPLSTPVRQATQKYNGTRMVREVSRPKSVPQGLEAGYIPGQSFVGWVLEVGSDVDKTIAAKEDWVVGLVDTRKCGPMDEFIVIDWRQIHRVSAPNEPCPLEHPISTGPTLVSETPSTKPTENVTCNHGTQGKDFLVPHFAPLTFEELALLPLCGIPAYLAVKTCIDAFPVDYDCFDVDKPTNECPHPALTQRRRALVLRGHDGVGAMAVQMLVRQGWRVSVHVPFSRVPWDATQAEADGFMLAIEDRLKKFGADEVTYDDGISHSNCQDGEVDNRKAAVVKVIETLLGDGDVFDAILDFVGGKEIREASERLLRLNGSPGAGGVGQFTTLLVDDALDDPISTLAGNSRSNLADRSTFTLNDFRSYTDEHIRETHIGDIGRRVKYTWMKGVFESEDEEVWEILNSVLRLALEDGIRPHLEEPGGEIFGRRRVVALENVSDFLVDSDLLSDGGMVVVRVVR